MKKWVIITLGIIMVSNQVPIARANSELTIPPGGYETITWTVRTRGRGLFGHFEVTNGSDITFFICNEPAFNDWREGHAIEAHAVMKDVTVGDYEYLATPGPTWYLVFDNTDEASITQTVVVDFHIDLTAPSIECSVKNNDVLSGTCEITVTAIDRFKIYSIEYTVAASSYPTSYSPLRGYVQNMEGNSISFNLNTEQMENGNYYISILVNDVSYNEQRMLFDFQVENDPVLGIVRLLTSPLVGAFILLGVVGIVVVQRRRRRVIRTTDSRHAPLVEAPDTADTTSAREPADQIARLEQAPVVSERARPREIEVAVDLRVVVFIIGALALFAPYMLVLQLDQGTVVIDAMTWKFTRSDSYWWFDFMVDYLMVVTFPFTVWRLALVYQMIRYYRGRSTRRTTFLLAVVAEMVEVTVDLVYTHVLFTGYWGPLLTIPTPLMLVGASVFLWLTPYPVPKTPFDDQPEPDKWWEKNTQQEVDTQSRPAGE